MNTGQEKFAQTEPFDEVNDVDKLSKKAGLEMSDDEELALKTKLEERDDSRLDLDSAEQTLADSDRSN
ncbi:MAG: hypothetical protein Tsb0014_25640 [Pleurocapsa sp.]